jgi:hypothetical protein
MSSSDGDKSDRSLHPAHLWAVRLGPYLLAFISVTLADVAIFASRSDGVTVAFIGAALLAAILAAVLPRVSGEFKVSKEGMTTNLLDLVKVDPGRFVIDGPAVELAAVEVTTTAAIEATAAATHPQNGQAHAGLPSGTGTAHNPTVITVDSAPTILDIINAAAAQGWTVQRSRDLVRLHHFIRHLDHATKLNPGDSYSVAFSSADVHQRATASLLESLVAAGLKWPPPTSTTG